MRKILALILRFKKWAVRKENNEYVLHFLVTDYILTPVIVVMAVTGNAAFFPLVPVAGFLINMIGEVAMRDANIKDALAGTYGITLKTLIVAAMLLILQHYNLYNY